MKRILIADANKSSLVMTSEVFKDHFQGVQVLVAKSSADAIELAKNSGEVDAYIVDFDLPDANGAITASKLKAISPTTPVLITAFDKPDVVRIIEHSLAAHEDCQNWIKKPVRADFVVSVAQRFIEGKYRIKRRIRCNLPAVLELMVRKIEVVKVAAVAPVKAKKVTKKITVLKAPKPDVAQKYSVSRILVPVAITDASHGGCKITVDAAFYAKPKNREIAKDILLEQGTHIQLLCPKKYVADIDTLNAWQALASAPAKATTAAVKAGTKVVSREKTPTKATTKASKIPVATISVLKDRTGKAADSQMFKGRVAWILRSDKDFEFGIEAESMAAAKRLFDAALAMAQATNESLAIERESQQDAAPPSLQSLRTSRGRGARAS